MGKLKTFIFGYDLWKYGLEYLCWKKLEKIIKNHKISLYNFIRACRASILTTEEFYKIIQEIEECEQNDFNQI